MVRGQEFHSIIRNIFDEVHGYMQSEQLQVNCPRCGEREGLLHPDDKFNLEINTAKRAFRCWKCEDPIFSGSLGRLVRIFGGDAEYELYKSYAGTFYDYSNIEDEKEFELVKLPNEMIYFSQMDTNNPNHFEAYNYMINDRKLTRDVLIKYRLGFCMTGKYSKRIIIPSFDIDGEVNYFVARSYDPILKKKKPYMNPYANKDRIIFNEGLINWDSTVYLIEGVFDMFSVLNSIPMLGKTLSTTLFYRLKELKPEVIVLLDPDAYIKSIELFYMLSAIYEDCEDKVKIVKLPTTEDIDELRRNHGIKTVIKALYSARDLNIDDYFAVKLKKPYEKRYTKRRFKVNSKYSTGR